MNYLGIVERERGREEEERESTLGQLPEGEGQGGFSKEGEKREMCMVIG